MIVIFFQLCCRGGIFFGDSPSPEESIISFQRVEHLTCELPPYIFLSAILCYITVCIFLKLAALAKFIIMVIMATGYIVVMLVTHPAVFKNYDILA